MIISHNSPEYIAIWNNTTREGRHNGAYYYSREIVDNIIPLVSTSYNWVTINCAKCVNHSIVFIHNNMDLSVYNFLGRHKDLILVVGVESTVEKAKKFSDKIICLPLSVDVEEVKKYDYGEKLYDLAYVGRPDKRTYKTVKFNENCDFLMGIERKELLRRMSKYRRVYAVGRCAIEAKVLGCEVLPYDSRYPDPSIWKVLDNKQAAKILQKELNKIEGANNG